MVSVLLSAHIERFSVSRMRDFFLNCLYFNKRRWNCYSYSGNIFFVILLECIGERNVLTSKVNVFAKEFVCCHREILLCSIFIKYTIEEKKAFSWLKNIVLFLDLTKNLLYRDFLTVWARFIIRAYWYGSLNSPNSDCIH